MPSLSMRVCLHDVIDRLRCKTLPSLVASLQQTLHLEKQQTLDRVFRKMQPNMQAFG